MTSLPPRNIRTGLLCSWFLLVTATGQTPDVHVQVKRVVKVYVKPDKPAYSIAYDYDVIRRPSVHIDGLGTVPPKGSLSYILLERELVFRDASDHGILVKVPLAETVNVASKPPLTEVPSEDEFPANFRVFPWNADVSLQERANRVLNKYFRYRPHEQGAVNYISTTYTPLKFQAAPPGVMAKAALLLSFPFDQATGKYFFRVQLLAKEGRTHSDQYRDASNPAVMSAAQALVDGIVDEMTRSTKGTP